MLRIPAPLQQKDHKTIATNSQIQSHQNAQKKEAKSKHYLQMLRIKNGNYSNDDTRN